MSFDTGKVRTTVLGAPIDAIDWLRCLDRIVAWASRRESRYVCMCNVHSIVTARQDPKFRWVVSHADLAAPDGAPVAWRLRRMGHRGQERIDGPDLMWRCCVRAAGAGLAVFLYGGTADTLARLRARLERELPELIVAGYYAPPFRAATAEEDEETVRMIEQSGAQIVFVALGCPKQEAWMAAHRYRVRAVMIGVGAAFDYHAGVVARAPHWMRNAGLEWFHRLWSEPRRLWRRYLVTNTLFFAYLLDEFLRGGNRARSEH
jgi:N-acetylglucosaminyldiphosphoundecaprenol N-acetyl-beta-D-mannosaminyltransferase